MVIVENILYASIKDLEGFGFSSEFLRTRTKENRQELTRHYSHINGVDPDQHNQKEVTLIDYLSIPEQTRLDKKLPSREELLKQIRVRELSRLVTFNTEAYNYFLSQPTTARRGKEKAEQASCFIAIAKAKPNQVKALGYSSKDEFYQDAINFMNRLAKERSWHAFKLTTLAGLRKRLTPFQQYLKEEITLADACKSLDSGKAGNNNASKIGADQHALLVQLYSDANAKPNFEQVWDIYTRKASQMVSLGHWDENVLISPTAVRAYLSKPEIRQLWYEARHGYQEYRNVFEPITQRDRPSYANALWVIDGTPSHRYFQHGEKGRYFRFNIFPVLDAHSWCVLGFWLSESENTEAVLGALRSACWVSNCLPHQILYDNSSAIQSYRAQEAIDKISVVSFPATAGNARAKIIEPFFHAFNQDVQKFRKGFTGNPFAVSINNRANRESLAKMVKNHELALAEQALGQAIEDLTIWNNKPRKALAGLSPIQAYRKSVELTKAKQRPFSELIDIEAFWTLPGDHKKIRTYEDGKQKMVNTFIAQQYEFTNRGIDITINEKRFTYDIEDPGFRKIYIGQRFTVKYEPNPERWTAGQPERLLLYLQGAPLQWKGMHVAALPIQRMPMAVADYQPGTRTALNARIENKKAQRAMVQQEFKEIIKQTQRNGTYTEVITDNAFDKQVLQDTQETIYNAIIDGSDTWFNAPQSSEQKEKIDEPAPPAKKMDRLSDEFDKPLPLD